MTDAAVAAAEPMAVEERPDEASPGTDLKEEQKSFNEGPPLGVAGRSDSLLSVRDQLDELHRRRDEVRREIQRMQTEEASLTDEINGLEAQLNGDEGPGDDAPMDRPEGDENLDQEGSESCFSGEEEWDEEAMFVGSEHGRSGSEDRERADFAPTDEHPDGSHPNDQPPPEDREHKDAAHGTDDRADGRPQDHEHRAGEEGGERGSSPRRTNHALKDDNGKSAGDYYSGSRRAENDHRQYSSGQPGANDDKLAEFFNSRPSLHQGDHRHAAPQESRAEQPRSQRPRQATSGRDMGSGGDLHRRADRRAPEKDAGRDKQLRPPHADDRRRRSSADHKQAVSHANSGSGKYDRERGAEHGDRARRSSRPKHEAPMLAPRVPSGNDRPPMHSSASRGAGHRSSRDHHPSAPSGQGRSSQRDARPPATHGGHSHHHDGYRERPPSGGHRLEQAPPRRRGSGGGGSGGGNDMLQPARHHADVKSRHRSRTRRLERRTSEHDGRANALSHQGSSHHPGSSHAGSLPLRPAPGHHASGGHGHSGHSSNHASRGRYH
mmetsp:Transcript_70499/g.131855  ORF Transcript_70499/g.131855 Transcript_70499/m.131855 type:complete len:549 (-) Transcript_70499:12-1658(-)